MDDTQLAVLRQQLDVLWQAIASLKAAQMQEAVIAPLRRQVAQIEQQINTGGGAVIAGGVNTQGGDFAGRDSITGETIVIAQNGVQVVIGEQPIAMTAVQRESALGRYLSHVISRNRYLQLQGIRSGGKLVNIELEH